MHVAVDSFRRRKSRAWLHLGYGAPSLCWLPHPVLTEVCRVRFKDAGSAPSCKLKQDFPVHCPCVAFVPAGIIPPQSVISSTVRVVCSGLALPTTITGSTELAQCMLLSLYQQIVPSRYPVVGMGVWKRSDRALTAILRGKEAWKQHLCHAGKCRGSTTVEASMLQKKDSNVQGCVQPRDVVREMDLLCCAVFWRQCDC